MEIIELGSEMFRELKVLKDFYIDGTFESYLDLENQINLESYKNN